MAMGITRVIGVVGLLVLLTCDGAAEDDAAQNGDAAAALPQPAVLFAAASSIPVHYGWVDLTFLSELKERGFEVDFTKGLSEITWERIRNYNVLVIPATPDSYAAQHGKVRPAEDYLAQPTGLEVMRGRRVESAGLLEIEPVHHAVEVALPNRTTGSIGSSRYA